MHDERKPTIAQKGSEREKLKEYEREHKTALVILWMREEKEFWKRIAIRELGLKEA